MGADLALISLGTTPGLRRADDAFAEIARAAGVSCEVVRVSLGASGRLRRQITVTDTVEALAARRAARSVDARATVYSSTTAALLQPDRTPYAVRFDSPAALNRPGPSGAWQRARERRVFGGAAALLPWGQAAAAAIPAQARPRLGRVIPLHVPVDVAPADGERRDIDALAYAGYPQKRGLDILISAWAKAAMPDARLVVAGIDRQRAEDWLRSRDVRVPASVEWRGLMERAEWERLLGRARLFVNASRREDHGLSQLEALAAGALLVTAPSAGPYEALPLARKLDPRLVAAAAEPSALAAAIAVGLQTDPEGYADRAEELLAPYRPAAIQSVFEADVLAALGLS